MPIQPFPPDSDPEKYLSMMATASAAQANQIATSNFVSDVILQGITTSKIAPGGFSVPAHSHPMFTGNIVNPYGAQNFAGQYGSLPSDTAISTRMRSLDALIRFLRREQSILQFDPRSDVENLFHHSNERNETEITTRVQLSFDSDFALCHVLELLERGAKAKEEERVKEVERLESLNKDLTKTFTDLMQMEI